MHDRELLRALGSVLSSIRALRNGRALAVLVGTFALAGLIVAMAESALARSGGAAGPVQAAIALFVAFYGGNAAGILAMDDARGGPVREVQSALRTAWLTAHRLLLAIGLVGLAGGVVAAALVALFWASRAAVSGAVAGPLLFGIAVPLGVLVTGVGGLALLAVVVPLAAPAVWSGASTLEVVRTLGRIVRRRLPETLLLMTAASLLTAAVGAVVTGVVMVGGRLVAELGVAVVGVEVPAPQLMAGLFGYGLRSLAAAGTAPGATSGHAAAALVGGGVVFALGLLLPGLVYLRATCAVYLAMGAAAAAAPVAARE